MERSRFGVPASDLRFPELDALGLASRIAGSPFAFDATRSSHTPEFPSTQWSWWSGFVQCSVHLSYVPLLALLLYCSLVPVTSVLFVIAVVGVAVAVVAVAVAVVVVAVVVVCCVWVGRVSSV